MRQELSRADDNELHEELSETDLRLSIDRGEIRVELLLAEHMGDGPEVCCYYTPLVEIIDTFVGENDKEELQALADFLRESLVRIKAKILSKRGNNHD